MAASTKMLKKSLDSSSDETRSFEKGKIDLADLGESYDRARYFGAWLELGKVRKTDSEDK
jgi:hypothetical protein